MRTTIWRRLTAVPGVVLAAVVAGLVLELAAGPSRAGEAVSCPVATNLGGQPGWPAGGVPVAINNRGEILGTRGRAGAVSSFVWTQGRAVLLGTLGGASTEAAGINDRGQVVGWSQTRAGRSHAFLWEGGKMTDLGTLGGTSSAASAINTQGEIVGTSTTRGVGAFGGDAFLWRNRRMSDLGTLGGAAGATFPARLAINDRTQVVGPKTVFWQAGKLTHLGVLPGGHGSNDAVAINERGQIAGYSSTRSYEVHAFLWRDGKMRDLGTLPGGRQSRATAMDERGEVVGSSDTANTGPQHGVLWRAAETIDLGTLPGDLYGDAVAINDNGQIVGWSSASSLGSEHAVLWTLKPTAAGRCSAPNPSQSGDSVVVREASITVGGPIDDLRAQPGRAMVRVPYLGPDSSLGTTCVDLFVWDRRRRKIVTVFDHRRCNGAIPLQDFGGIALTAAYAAWIRLDGGNILDSAIMATSLTTGRTVQLATESAGGQGAFGRIIADPAGDSGLLAYRDYTRCAPRPDVTSADVPCPPGVPAYSTTKDEIRLALPVRRVVARADHELSLLAVGGGRVVAQLSEGPLIVLAPKRVSTRLRRYDGFSAEHLIATYSYKPGEVRGAATDGRTLAVLRRGTLDVIPLPGSHGIPARSLQLTATRLADLDGKTAVYLNGNTVYLLNLTSGHRINFARPAAPPIDAQLERDGLYLSSGKTLSFTPRAAVERRLRD